MLAGVQNLQSCNTSRRIFRRMHLAGKLLRQMAAHYEYSWGCPSPCIAPLIAGLLSCLTFKTLTDIRCSLQGCNFCSLVTGPAEPGACISRESSCDRWLPTMSTARAAHRPLYHPSHSRPALLLSFLNFNTLTDGRCSLQGCNFCSPVTGPAEPGACISRESSCDGWLPSYEYSSGCPSPYTAPIIAGLLIYLAAFSVGVGPVPWAVNAELYPQQASFGHCVQQAVSVRVERAESHISSQCAFSSTWLHLSLPCTHCPEQAMLSCTRSRQAFLCLYPEEQPSCHSKCIVEDTLASGIQCIPN